MSMLKFKKKLSKRFGVRIPIKGLRSYFRENWGAPAIICFMVLLMTAALFLAEGMEEIADAIAVCAYYFLVAGVVLQVVCHVKYNPRKENDRK